MRVQPIRQTCRVAGRWSAVKRPITFAQSLMQAGQSAAHAFSRQRVHVIGFGLVEKVGYVGGRHGELFGVGAEVHQVRMGIDEGDVPGWGVGPMVSRLPGQALTWRHLELKRKNADLFVAKMKGAPA